jgi:hypothetical protein
MNEALLDRLDAILALDSEAAAIEAGAIARELLEMGEASLGAYVSARGDTPTLKKSEGFRLLALQRQGARGEPSFNACRETCRELVYHHNCIAAAEAPQERVRLVRLMAMVARHLLLFVDGKLENAGLGEFCCSSKPLRRHEMPNGQVPATGPN